MGKKRKITSSDSSGKKMRESYRNYKQEQLAKALSAVKKGVGLRAASVTYQVPYSTLKDKRDGKSQIGAKSGGKSVLSMEEKNLLVQWILEVGKAGFPPTPDQIKDSVWKIVTHLKKKNPFTKNRPRRHWLDGFMKRHSSELSARVPQNLSQRRADVTEVKLRAWFQEVELHLKNENLRDIESNRVFNCDETAALLNPKGLKVIVKKSLKSAHIKVGSDDKECMTVLVMGNAAGQLAPPMVMYAYQRLPPGIIEKAPKNWAIGKSELGWMTSESFYEYISNVFYPWVVKEGIKFPIVLYLDGHSSHLTLHLSNFCLEHQIVLVALYPNSTHLTQPMDVGLFSCLKKAWRKTVSSWRFERNGIPLSKIDFAQVFKTALDSLDMTTVMKNSFKTCGLHPFDENAVKYSELFSNDDDAIEDLKYETVSQPPIIHHDFNKLEFVETLIDKNVITMFKHAKQRDGNWYGEEKYAELFTFWKRCAESKSAQENNSHCDKAALPPVNSNENYSLETLNIVVEKEKIEDENIFVHESVLKEFVAQDVELVIESDINLSEVTVDDMIIVEDSPESSSQALSNCLSNKDENCKVLTEIELNSNPSTTIKNEVIDVKKPKTQHVSGIFKNILFYPKKEPAKPGKRQPKEKVPAVATGDTWRKWKKEKEDQKDLAEKIKKERKILREAQTKIKQEKDKEIAEKKKEIQLEKEKLKKLEEESKRLKNKKIEIKKEKLELVQEEVKTLKDAKKLKAATKPKPKSKSKATAKSKSIPKRKKENKEN